MSRKDAEEGLRDAQARWDALTEACSQAVFTMDSRGTILMANSRAEQLFDYTREELRGSYFERLLPDRLRRRAAMQRRGLFGASKVNSVTAEVIARRRDGSEFAAELTLRRIGARRSLAVGLVTDTTDRKRLQEQLAQLQKVESIYRLAGGIAHDFNNILTLIQGYSEIVLENTADDEPLHGPAAEIFRNATRASALTKQLLQFSRPHPKRPGVVNLNRVVRDAESMLRRMIGEDIELILRLSEGIGEVHADTIQIEQILVNLAVNARDAMPQGGSLTIRTAVFKMEEGGESRPHLSLMVSDTGIGMTEDVRAHIFEPFFTTKAPDKGTGLGLSTVYTLVKGSGGSIWVSSEAGKGATFQMIFPLAQAEEPAEPEEKAAVSPGGGSETVLLAEDELEVRQFVRESLSARGYTVISAANGPEALDIARRRSGGIDLLLTDVVMPRMSGLELARCMRALYPSVRVLYLSGYADTKGGVGPEEHALFLEKPFTPNALAQRIRALMTLGSQTRNPSIVGCGAVR